MTIHRAILGLVLLAFAGMPGGPAWALDAGTRLAAAESGDDSTRMQPILPTETTWVGEVILVAMGLIVAAAYFGPIVRRCMPQELPPTHSHDEPPGTSGHHGGMGLAVGVNRPEDGPSRV